MPPELTYLLILARRIRDRYRKVPPTPGSISMEYLIWALGIVAIAASGLAVIKLVVAGRISLLKSKK